MGRGGVVESQAEGGLRGLVGSARKGQAVVEDTRGEFTAIGEDANPGGISALGGGSGAFVDECQMRGFPGADTGTFRTHPEGVVGKTLAEAELEFPLDEAQFDASSVADGRRVLRIVDSRKKRCIGVRVGGVDPEGIGAGLTFRDRKFGFRRNCDATLRYRWRRRIGHFRGLRTLQFRDADLQFAHFLLLSRRARGHHRNRIRDAAIFTQFRNVVEEGEEAIVVALRNWIELVVVAVRAFERQAEPCHPESADAVGHILNAVLLFDDPAFGVDHVVPAKAGSDALVESGLGQQIAGQLLGDETVVGEVPVEGFNHPVTPAPHVAFGVVVKAMGIGVAGHVQPVDCHPLAIGGGGQQAIRCGRIGSLAALTHRKAEAVDFGGRGRQARQVQ